MIVSCDQCGVKLKVDEAKIRPEGSKLKCPKCANIFTVRRPEEPAAAPAPPPPAAAPSVESRPLPPRPAPQSYAAKWDLDWRTIVVGCDGHAVLAMIRDILEAGGYRIVSAADGVEAMIAIEQKKPFLAILDVALPRIYGFEVCDRIKEKEESRDIKVILIASIYDKTRYKREPTSLYGADDYIEKHHITDFLLKKVQRLAAGETAAGEKTIREEQKFYAPSPPEARPTREREAVEMRREEIRDFPAPSAVDPQQAEAARRFARIILSDIALYNQGAVDEGIKGGNFRNALAAELKEGRDLYNTRVSADVRSSMDYFDDEIEKFIEKKRRIVEMGG